MCVCVGDGGDFGSTSSIFKEKGLFFYGIVHFFYEYKQKKKNIICRANLYDT